MNLASLLSFLEDNSGGTSSMRVLVVAIVAAVLGVWVFACVKAGGEVPMSDQSFNILMLALGAKFAQRAIEKPAAAAPAAPGQNVT